MSKLRKNLLEVLTHIGNASGCHQMPERSFFYHGRQFPVCARCTGVTVGQIAAILCLLLRIPVSFFASVSALGIMGTDWSIQEFNIKTSTNTRRFITGICGGFGIFSLYILVGKKILKFLRKNTVLH